MTYDPNEKMSGISWTVSDQILESIPPEKLWIFFRDKFQEMFDHLVNHCMKEGISPLDVNWGSLKGHQHLSYQLFQRQYGLTVKHKGEPNSPECVEFPSINEVPQSGVLQSPKLTVEELQHLKDQFKSYIATGKVQQFVAIDPATTFTEVTPEPEPKPLTYQELKEKAIKEGKLKPPPTDPNESSGLI